MNIDHRAKRDIMTENKYLCSHDMFKNIPTTKTQKYKYNGELTIPANDNISVVEIMATDLFTLGHKFVSMKTVKPAMVYMIDKEFNGSNIDILKNVTECDFVLRSNFYKTMNAENIYPLEDGEITYAQNVFIFRDEKYEISSQKYIISVITFSPIKNPVLLGSYMRPDDYLGYQETIESIFQGACVAGHDTLILSDMGCLNYGIPINEAIEILNICILKYCTLFKFIIFAIPVNNPTSMNLFAQFAKGIIKPQSLTDETTNETSSF